MNDPFSEVAQLYSEARPTYPASLGSFLSSLCAQRDLAWDCATGNGQAALGLTPFFKRIYATDISALQLRFAFFHSQIEYFCCPAERTSLPTACVDLLTVAEALHWFDHSAFEAEAIRVLKPKGVLAVWHYDDLRVAPDIDQYLSIIRQEVQDDWCQRALHATEPKQFSPLHLMPIALRDFPESQPWTAERMTKNINTWSAVQRYVKRHANGRSKIDALTHALTQAWGHETRYIHFNIHLQTWRKLSPV